MKLHFKIIMATFFGCVLLLGCSEKSQEEIKKPMREAAEDVSVSAERAKEATKKAAAETAEAVKVVAEESAEAAKTTAKAAVESGSAAYEATKEAAKETKEEVDVNLEMMKDNVKSDIDKASSTLK